MKKVAFITSILGNYETTCKQAVEQTVDCDFICFTDNEYIEANGWDIDTHPYHDTHKSPVDKGFYLNSPTKPKGILSILDNRHPFNLAKYYKTQWHLIPRLQEYETIIWCDGSIEILAPNAAEYISEICAKYGMSCWHHEMRGGVLLSEAHASYLPKYHDRHFNGFTQHYQDIIRQYLEYVADGYDEDFFKQKYDRVEGRGRGDHFGVWATGCLGFSNTSPEVKKFTDAWYLEILKHTTQDQVSFPKVVQDTKLVPYTFPDAVFTGVEAHTENDLYKVHKHGA
jgi:hypothetical protein